MVFSCENYWQQVSVVCFFNVLGLFDDWNLFSFSCFFLWNQVRQDKNFWIVVDSAWNDNHQIKIMNYRRQFV